MAPRTRKTEPEDPAPEEKTEEPAIWTPDADDFLSLKGKAYLPARRRIQWMRGLPVPHPDWTIDTYTEVFDKGVFERPGRVKGGFAGVRANVYDEGGRLISTGVKSEYSENFPDFLEKAETGAIARALAVAGYGTESALDLDEGAEAERPADAPVEVGGAPVRSPVVTPGTGPSVEKGGKNTFATSLQVARIAALSSRLKLGTVGMTGVIEAVLGVSVPSLSSDSTEAARELKTFLADRSADELGKLIVALEKSESS
ncbi:MAG: hypothetical protein FIA93_09070 [Deltaproteobacteria bacterium]|nr:hypothetical protein [Deltaproteobacteria bacterium]